ncbi:DUF2019 domain-containing protein [Nitratireductor sp. ZSWI3]|uniref:DUF2019 domain-containing protein n=1 Tax=Nitratireductor sp. ZSWI3 TaxID=2966359 RepID=UPI00214FEDA3|nr:DUF2019 domain-containing protein [Nitratireductor sp. ZSWI3]MCR4266095.1 DUF2019 domain-containing protein [Nitratireductor sp. ZSWI3]
MTVKELIERFAEIGVAQDEALLDNETAKFNKLYREKIAIETELRDRPGDQRHHLMALYAHPNMQVRLNAANSTFAIDMTRARAQLEAIAASKQFPQAGDAGMALWAIDEGISKPDSHLPPRK